MSDQAPDLTEKVLGLRAFLLGPGGSVLHSTGVGPFAWVPGPNTAMCLGFASHSAPEPNCECGLYARHADSPDDGLLPPLPAPLVPAAVFAWGAMQIHADGFRAEHAEIVLLGYNPENEPLVREAARCYGVPAVPSATLAAEARKLGSPVPTELRPESAFERSLAAGRSAQEARDAKVITAISLALGVGCIIVAFAVDSVLGFAESGWFLLAAAISGCRWHRLKGRSS